MEGATGAKRNRASQLNQFIGGNNTQGESLSVLEGNLFDELVPKLQEAKPKIEDFSDIYSPEIIEACQKKLEEIQARAKENMGSVAELERGPLLEALVYDLAGRQEWFGQMAITPTSTYDDWFSHGDFILEAEDENGEMIKILIDLTTSCQESVIEKKLSYSRQKPAEGGLEKPKTSSLKFFSSDIEDAKGPVAGLPRVVIGIGVDTLRDLCQEVHDLEMDGKSKNTPIKTISKTLFLEQILGRLKQESASSIELNGQHHVTTKQLSIAQEFVSKTLREMKKGLPRTNWETPRDRTQDLLLETR